MSKHNKLAFKKNFYAKAAAAIFIADIVNIFYVNLHFLPEKLSVQRLLSSYAMMGISPAQLAYIDLNETRQLIVQSMSYLFLGFLIYHFFVYSRLYLQKPWAKNYVSFYALTGFILTLAELPSLIGDHLGWSALMVLTSLIYVYCFFGLRKRKKIEQAA